MATLLPIVTEGVCSVGSSKGKVPDSALRTGKAFKKDAFEQSLNGGVGSMRQRKWRHPRPREAQKKARRCGNAVVHLEDEWWAPAAWQR